MIKSISSKSGFTVVFEDGPLMIHRSSPSYEEAAAALSSGDYTRLRYLLDPVGAISRYTSGTVTVSDSGDLVYAGKHTGKFCREMLERCSKAKIGWENIQPFFDRWVRNTSSRASEELDQLLLSMDFALTTDGGILAYKVVMPTYVEPDTGLHLCTVGKTVSVPREAVSRFGKAGSERGFIAGSSDYVSSNTLVGKTLLVKIMPEDVVGVFSKPCRQILTCKFSVLAEQSNVLPFALYDADLKPLFIKN